MATAQVQHASASFGADGTQSAARVGRDGALVIRSHAEQLGIEGKIFIAGVGLEGTALTGLTTAVDDTTPSLWLQAPAGSLLRRARPCPGSEYQAGKRCSDNEP